METEDLNKTLTDLIGKELVARQQSVAYYPGQKTKRLGIDPNLALATNCVSEKIAGTMAKNVALSFNSDWGIGITGYASPVPEKNIEELFACFAISLGQQLILVNTIHAKKQTPLEVRLFYTKHVLQQFFELITRQQ